MSELVNSAAVAAYVGVTRSAVANWLKRGTLPEGLRPLNLGGSVAPMWPEEKLPAIRAWHDGRKSVRNREKQPPGDPVRAASLRYQDARRQLEKAQQVLEKARAVYANALEAARAELGEHDICHVAEEGEQA